MSSEKILIDVGEQNGPRLAPKWNSKSMPTSRSDFSKKPRKANEKSRFFWFLGVEVGSKNRSKIDQKMKPRREGILASIFDGFWEASWGAKSSQDRRKID